MSQLQGLDNLSSEDRILFHTFSQGPQIQPHSSLLHRAFETIVDAQPQDLAVDHNGSSLTYDELDQAANRLANHLIRKGLEPGQTVCLVAQRSFSMVIAIFAILKSGCQYIPLDGGVAPDKLLSHISNTTEGNFILCLSRYFEKVQRCTKNQQLIVLDAEPSWDQSESSERPQVEVAASSGAYVIYTSGTTGSPKGVDVSHENVTNLLCNLPGSLGIQRGTNVAQLLSVSFDMGQWEILGTLVNGGTLLLRTSDWDAVLKRAHVVISTPSILETLQKQEYHNIRTVALAGEPCPKPLADEWSKDVAFYNCCGPTEVTIVNTMQRYKTGHHLSIGKPIPNTKVYILDENEKPLPIGSIGTMWAGGRCVSRGYLGMPELTSQKFKYDKFANDGSLMFNTGDLGRWLEDGTIEHHGRLDDQVKIKGFRVELDGVSAAIEKTPGIHKGCAILYQNTLWAFYSSPSFIEECVVKSIVKSHQPYYAVPEKWVFLPSLPLTTNGKTDRKALIASIPALAGVKHLEEKKTNSLAVPEKCLVKADATSLVTRSEHTESTTSLNKYALPEKKGRHGLRALRHRFFSLYRRLFSLVFIANMSIVIFMIVSPSRRQIQYLATAIASNLTASVLFRQDHVVNFLFWLACSVPTSWPLFIRRNCAKVYHMGGLHSGFAVASVIWLLIFTTVATVNHKETSIPVLVITYLLDALLLTIVALAHPIFRAKFHNHFEMAHRFLGWTSLALFWVQTILSAASSSTASGLPLGKVVLQTPGVWLLAVATFSIALPWLKLRKVTVNPDVLSSHAVRLYFNYTTPTVGTAVRISERPLLEWHAFATIAKPAPEKGFSLLVSNAGDWTKRQINRAPTTLYVRGVPACGVLRIVPLFKSVVLVATGSGIGPCLPVIYARKRPIRIFWSTPSPEATFGSEIITAIKVADPRAVIWDTRKQGRPDIVSEVWKLLVEGTGVACEETGYDGGRMEAVATISNQKLTQKVVYGMESRGVPGFGAIWDS
ncbi:nonribosomal peptide synthetase 12 [Tricladium varicosporioides]|nr:nonribosomal peptide synthetase 12 [Hymenoscyphus varicosporioides]